MERVELYRERVQEHDLDVEEDEEDRRQVDADGEAPLPPGGTSETPDSNGSIFCFVPALGRPGSTNGHEGSSDAGIAAAKSA